MMRTQFMNDSQGEAPWFEYHADGEGSPTKQTIGQFPFVIGRDASADFRVDSNRVSRKHVVVEQAADGGYLLRDLESTNGTYVNGKRTDQTELHDGDVVVVADFQLTFFTGSAAGRGSATLVMTQPLPGSQDGALDLIVEVRRLQEMVTHRSTVCRFQPIVRLDTGRVHGYEAMRDVEVHPGARRQISARVHGTDCRLTERIQQQHRLCAAEQAAAVDDDVHLVFALQTSEVSADFLPDAFDRLATVLGPRHQLVAEIPETAVYDIPYFRRFVTELRERRIQLAYGGFCAGPSQIAEWLDFPPDYLKLAPAVTKGISRGSGGWRMMQAMLDVTRDLGCEVIASGIEQRTDAESLRELGCQYAQGDYFGPPAPLTAARGANLAAAAAGH